MSDWAQTGSYDKYLSTESHYYAEFPSGYNTSDTYYKTYNGSRMNSVTSSNGKWANVSNPTAYRYILWHWCYALADTSGKAMNRNIGTYKDQKVGSGGWEASVWEAIILSSDVTEMRKDAYMYQYGHYSTNWWKDVVYRQKLDWYQTYYTFKKETDGLESDTQVYAGGEISNVQHYVRYREK